MASFKDIVANTPKKDAFADGAIWTLRSMLEALQQCVFETHGYLEDDVMDEVRAALGGRLTVHTIFDIHHDSDECCSAEVLCLDECPTLLYKRIGDRSDYSDGLSVLDKELTRKLVAVLIEHRTRQAFAKMEAEVSTQSPEETLWQGTQYLVPLTETAFFVGSPKWALGFRHAFESHKAYTADGDGGLVRVLGFVKWANKAQSWESNKDTHVATFTTERGEATFDARNVIFTLLDDEEGLQKLARELNEPDHWQATKLEAVENYEGGFVHIAQHIRGQTFCAFAGINFTNREAAKQAYELLRQAQPGRFSTKHPEIAKHSAVIDTKLSMNLHDD